MMAKKKVEENNIATNKKAFYNSIIIIKLVYN